MPPRDSRVAAPSAMRRPISSETHHNLTRTSPDLEGSVGLASFGLVRIADLCTSAVGLHAGAQGLRLGLRALLASKRWRSAARYLACHSATCLGAGRGCCTVHITRVHGTWHVYTLHGAWQDARHSAWHRPSRGGLLGRGLVKLRELQRRADETEALGVEAWEERAAPISEECDCRHLRAHARVGGGPRAGAGMGKVHFLRRAPGRN